MNSMENVLLLRLRAMNATMGEKLVLILNEASIKVTKRNGLRSLVIGS